MLSARFALCSIQSASRNRASRSNGSAMCMAMLPSASRGHSARGGRGSSSMPLPSRSAEVDRFAHAVVGDALQRHAGVDDAADGAREIAARRIANREMIEAGMVGRGGGAARGSARY